MYEVMSFCAWDDGTKGTIGSFVAWFVVESVAAF